MQPPPWPPTDANTRCCLHLCTASMANWALRSLERRGRDSSLVLVLTGLVRIGHLKGTESAPTHTASRLCFCDACQTQQAPGEISAGGGSVVLSSKAQLFCSNCCSIALARARAVVAAQWLTPARRVPTMCGYNHVFVLRFKQARCARSVGRRVAGPA